jgi:hypothetical protein
MFSANFTSTAAVALLILYMVLTPALADGMRCGTKLVVSGDTKLEVLKKCGEPDFKETIKLLKESKQVHLSDNNINSNTASNRSGANLTNRHSSVSSNDHSGITLGTETIEAIEQWSYNQGPTKFIKLLTFRGGRLETVEEAERGFSDDSE